MRAERLLHVAPGREYALGPHAVHFVHDAVENAHADIGHAELVGVRKAERDADIHCGLIFENLVVFPADVAGGLLDALQYAVELIGHGVSCLSFGRLGLF